MDTSKRFEATQNGLMKAVKTFLKKSVDMVKKICDTTHIDNKELATLY